MRAAWMALFVVGITAGRVPSTRPRPVHTSPAPLPPIAIDALAKSPQTNPLYFFWTGQCSQGTVARDWHSKLAKLFTATWIPNLGYPHRFRDTFAVEQLLSGTPIDQVSALLGHSSIKVTERHYVPWAKARQEQMEANVVPSWEGDPLIPRRGLQQVGDERRQAHARLRLRACVQHLGCHSSVGVKLRRQQHKRH